MAKAPNPPRIQPMQARTPAVAALIAQRVEDRRPKSAPEHANQGNLRDTDCTAPNCDRKAYAGGFCNAHYLRSRNGGDMSSPVRRLRKAGARCETCEDPVGAKGAWGLCRRHYRRERAKVIKLAIIEAMGGLCDDCGGSFHHAAFDFHHLGDKEDSVSAMVSNSSFDAIAAEAAKCELLCANCHRIRHAKEERD